MSYSDKIKGCLVGLAVGDALGAPLEFIPRNIVRRLYPNNLRNMRTSENWKKGEYTDDTQMALCIANSLLEVGFSPQDVARRFLEWLDQDGKGCGIQTAAILENPQYLENPFKCSEEYFNTHSQAGAGNGAVMRCTPIALFCLTNPKNLVEYTTKVAQLTHWDPKAVESCLILNQWIAECIFFGKKDRRESVLKLVQDPVWERIPTIETLPESEIESSGYTVHTVEAAIWSFLTTSTFEDAVIRAANLGEDADTVAAVTGALAGAYYGLSAIPERWLECLMNRDEIATTAKNLVLATVRRAK